MYELFYNEINIRDLKLNHPSLLAFFMYWDVSLQREICVKPSLMLVRRANQETLFAGCTLMMGKQRKTEVICKRKNKSHIIRLNLRIKTHPLFRMEACWYEWLNLFINKVDHDGNNKKLSKISRIIVNAPYI